MTSLDFFKTSTITFAKPISLFISIFGFLIATKDPNRLLVKSNAFGTFRHLLFKFIGRNGGTRTLDTHIKSMVPYRLATFRYIIRLLQYIK